MREREKKLNLNRCQLVGWYSTVPVYNIFTWSDLVLIILYVKVKMDPKKEGEEGARRRKICGVSRVYLHVNTIGYTVYYYLNQFKYYIYILSLHH